MKTVSITNNYAALMALLLTPILFVACEQSRSTSASPALTHDPSSAIGATKTHATEGPAQYGNELKEHENSKNYIIYDIDIDDDGSPDKVVSSAVNSGNELIFFRRTNDSFTKVLSSINFTEDGGRTLDTISQEVQEGAPNPEVISIQTYYPREENSATHYISYSNEKWLLTRSVYTFSDWRSDPTSHYSCEVLQGTPMDALLSNDAASSIKQPPEDPEKTSECQRVSANKKAELKGTEATKSPILAP
ncbi:hypothetical protein [Luteimonas salinilitoris]|uniref:Secreted protein n=1 Tax=Luteimonas salinilitoris TaxID=3237697 RepID=A0ABV4HQB5_9GAMM